MNYSIVYYSYSAMWLTQSSRDYPPLWIEDYWDPPKKQKKQKCLCEIQLPPFGPQPLKQILCEIPLDLGVVEVARASHHMEAS